MKMANQTIKTFEQLISEIKRIATTYEYYVDEEDTKIEEIALHAPYGGMYEKRKPEDDIGLRNIPDLAVLVDWTNERLVIPVEIVEKLVKELQINCENSTRKQP